MVARGRRDLLRRISTRAGDHPSADHCRALGPARSATPDPPLGDPRDRLPGRGLPSPRLLGSTNSRDGAARARARARDLVLVPGLIVARAVLPLAQCQTRPAHRSRTRLALRDLARYRARSGSALAAISIGVLSCGHRHAGRLCPLRDVLDYGGRTLPPTSLPSTADVLTGSPCHPKRTRSDHRITSPPGNHPRPAQIAERAEEMRKRSCPTHSARDSQRQPQRRPKAAELNGNIYVPTPSCCGRSGSRRHRSIQR